MSSSRKREEEGGRIGEFQAAAVAAVEIIPVAVEIPKTDDVLKLWLAGSGVVGGDGSFGRAFGVELGIPG